MISRTYFYSIVSKEGVRNSGIITFQSWLPKPRVIYNIIKNDFVESDCVTFNRV